ncbi:hypothetical protein [Paenibacillus sp. yr247]|nr:hypothetical protein [Paenibacillus sp. yr247]
MQETLSVAKREEERECAAWAGPESCRAVFLGRAAAEKADAYLTS